MQIIQYEVLLKVLESGTLTSAAEELGYSQSGLTRLSAFSSGSPRRASFCGRKIGSAPYSGAPQ